MKKSGNSRKGALRVARKASRSHEQHIEQPGRDANSGVAQAPPTGAGSRVTTRDFYVDEQRNRGIPERDAPAAACWARWLRSDAHKWLAAAREEIEQCEKASSAALWCAVELAVNLKAVRFSRDRVFSEARIASNDDGDDDPIVNLAVCRPELERQLRKLKRAASIFKPLTPPVEPLTQAVHDMFHPHRSRIHALFDYIGSANPHDNPSSSALELMRLSVWELAIELKTRARSLQINFQTAELAAVLSRPGRPGGKLRLVAAAGAAAGLKPAELARVGLQYGFASALAAPAPKQQPGARAERAVEPAELEKLRQRLQKVWPRQ